MSQDWPAFNVEARPLDSLVPYARNARTHTADQVSALAASIEEWGCTNPVLIDEEGGVIAGHGRLLAAEKLRAAGRKIEEVPVIIAVGWSEAQKRAYVLADNQLAIAGSGWDEDKLKFEMQELESLHFDLSLTGFSMTEITTILGDGVDITGEGEGATASGADDAELLKWGDNKIPLMPDEYEGLTKLVARYVETFGLAHGFARWLIEGRHVV